MRRSTNLILLVYVLFFAGPIAIAVAAFYEWSEWVFGKFGRDVPASFEKVGVWILDGISKPVPDVTDAIPESSKRAYDDN